MEGTKINLCGRGLLSQKSFKFNLLSRNFRPTIIGGKGSKIENEDIRVEVEGPHGIYIRTRREGELWTTVFVLTLYYWSKVSTGRFVTDVKISRTYDVTFPFPDHVLKSESYAPNLESK